MITYILLILAGACNAIMDLSSENLLWSKWWNKAESANNKWKHKLLHTDVSSNPNETKPASFHVINIGVERFWGSSRWFVFLTDGWHLFQFFCFSLLTLAIITYVDPHINWILEFIYYKLTFTTAFAIVYQSIKHFKLKKLR